MATDNTPNPFGKLAADYRALRAKLPRQVSILAAATFKDNFRRQGILVKGTVQKWKARKLSPLMSAKARKRDGTRAILINTGQLRRGLQPRPTATEAVVVNETPYANYHNEGIEGRLPARPFMVTTPDLLDDIEKHVFAEIDKIWR